MTTRIAFRSRQLPLLLVFVVALTAPGAWAQSGIIYTMCNFGEYEFLCGADPDEPGDHAVTYGPFSTSTAQLSVSENGRTVSNVGFDSMYVANIDGSGAVGVFPLEMPIRGQAISPDGSKLAYVGDGTNSLYVYDLRSEEAIEVLEYQPGWFWNRRAFPVWSPDGEHLLLDIRDEATESVALYAVNVDGRGDLRQVTFPGADAIDSAADWSPTGNGRLAFTRRTQMTGTESSHEIFVVDIDANTPPTQVYQSMASPSTGRNLLSGVQWSPDGSELAFIREESPYPSQFVLYTMPASGGGLQALHTTDFGRGYWYARLVEWARPAPVHIVVNDARDLDDLDAEDGVCDAHPDAGEQCTLRAAIQEANARPGKDEIGFDLAGSSDYVLAVTSPLPVISETLSIDGTTQPGTGTTPLVQIQGNQSAGSGLTIGADDVTIRGLIVTSFGSHGIHVTGGSNGVLEGLIVGSDALGSDGLGNGGDGIHISGGENWRIGAAEESGGETSELDPTVILAGNARNGISIRNEANASLVRAGKGGVAAESMMSGFRLSKLVVGMVEAAAGPVALPNGHDGIRLEGVMGASLGAIRVSDAVEHAVNVVASQSVEVSDALMGVRKSTGPSGSIFGSIQKSIFRVVESADISIGSDDPGTQPVQGGGAKGWFIEVEKSQDVRIRNTLGGITDFVEEMTSKQREALRNLAGGIRVFDSPKVTVGAPGVPTIFANNGGDETQPQAGLFALGDKTRLLRIKNAFFGTTPEGLSGLGNIRSGLILDGIRSAVVGGEAEEDRVVSAGNGTFGFLFKNLDLPNVDPLPVAVEVSHLVSDFVENAQGQMVKLSNGESGVKVDRSNGLLMKYLSIGPSTQHGIEILDSRDIRIESASIGSKLQKSIQRVADLAAPEGHGISISASADVQIGNRVDSLVSAVGSVFINGVGGHGIYATETDGLSIEGIAVGEAPEGSADIPELIEKLGSNLEAVMIHLSNEVVVEHSKFLGNGASSTSGAGGLFIDESSFVRMLENQFGILGANDEPKRSNFGAALRAVNARKFVASVNQIMGHECGMLLENTDLALTANTFTSAGHLGGDGCGLQAKAASIVHAARNTFSDNQGAALWFSDDSDGLIRHNNIQGNGQGVVVSSSGGKSMALTGRVQAPDNWWGDASGPGGAGPGDGDAISDKVEAPTWLSGPLGVIVEPASRIVKAGALTNVTIPVSFSSPLVGEDVLDITVSDERGWVTSDTAFEVSVPVSGSTTEIIEATLFQAGVSAVTIQAVSRTDPTLVGEAVVVVGLPRRFSTMDSDAQAGDSVLDADADEVFVVGGDLILNPGGANEETVTVAGFGSIRLDRPLLFDHRAGEPIAPANRFAVGREGDPAEFLPRALGVTTFPNPTTTTLNLSLEMPQTGRVRIELYDVVGRRISVLEDGVRSAGRHEMSMDVSSLPAGVYLTRISTSGSILSRTIVVAR